MSETEKIETKLTPTTLYDTTTQSAYDGLVLQTRLKGYLDAISLTVDESGVRMGFPANDNN